MRTAHVRFRGRRPRQLGRLPDLPVSGADLSTPPPVRRPGGSRRLHRGECPEIYWVGSNRWSTPSKTTTSGSYATDLSGAGGGGRSGRSHRLRWRRILSMTGALSIRLMILSGPPQGGQIRGSASYTFLMSCAQERLSLRAKSSAQRECCARDSGASGSLAGAEPARRAPARRTFENAPQ